MMKKISILLAGMAVGITASATNLTISPGQLESLVGSGTDASLVLEGSIDARDLAYIEKLPASVKTLDLRKVKVAPLTSYGKAYFGRTLFSESEIPGYTFFKSGVETLLLPETVKTIGEGAFAASEITSIEIPEGVTALSDYAFYGCSKLKEVKLPSTLKSIGKGAFGNCASLETLNLTNTGLTELPERAFAGSTNLKTVMLPESVKRIGRETFSLTGIETLALPEVTEFDAYALSGMPELKSLTINPGAIISEGMLMDNTSLTSLTGLADGVPDYFAANCANLDAKTAIGQVSDLGKYSFANNAASELLLPGSLKSVDRGALSGLNSLKSIDVTSLANQVPAADEYSFEGLDQPSIKLIVGDDYVEAWKEDPYWSLFDIVASSQTSGTENIADEYTGIEVTHRGGVISVTSPVELTDVRVYTSDGRIAFVASPADTHIDIDASTLPSGIVVVVAANVDGKKHTVSLLVR